jgi:hypothetical protein
MGLRSSKCDAGDSSALQQGALHQRLLLAWFSFRDVALEQEKCIRMSDSWIEIPMSRCMGKFKIRRACESWDG